MKTIISAALFATLIFSPAFAQNAPAADDQGQTEDSAAPQAPAKPELTPEGEATAAEKAACLTRAGFHEAATPKLYYQMKNAGERPFYISGKGVVTFPSWEDDRAVRACGDKLGAKH